MDALLAQIPAEYTMGTMVHAWHHDFVLLHPIALCVALSASCVRTEKSRHKSPDDMT